MQIRKFTANLFIASLSFIVPLIAHANITLYDNTNSYGTAKVDGKCSSGTDGGVVGPHSHLTVSDSDLNLICGFSDCDADIYMSKDCSAPKVATVTLEIHGLKRKVGKIRNDYVDGYVVSGGGSSASVDGGPAKGFFDFIKRIF